KQIALPRTVDEPLQGPIGRYAGAHQRGGLIDRQRIVFQQIFCVGHQHMSSAAAIDADAEKALLGAEIFIARQTVAALAAADPWENRTLSADQILRHVRADFLDGAGDLVAEGEGQCHAARGVELLAAAEIGIAVLDVKVGMAKSAALDPDQNFPPLGLRCVDDGFAQRRIKLDQRLATHERHEVSPKDVQLLFRIWVNSRAMATNPPTETVSGRRVSSISAAATSRAGSIANDFRLCRNILRR